MDVEKNNNRKSFDEMNLPNSCLTTANDDDVQNDMLIIENQVHDNDSDDDDYMA